MAIDGKHAIRDKNGYTALHWAVFSSQTDVVRALLPYIEGADACLTDNNGWTAMHVACYVGQASQLELLQNADIDVNSVDRFGLTPLHIAAMYGHVVCCEELLTLGASLSIGDSRGQTPLHKAAYRARLAVLDVLAPRYTQACLEQPDRFGRTALHLACMQDNMDCIRRLLLLAPRLISMIDIHGNSLAHYAARYDLAEALALFAEHGHDTNRSLFILPDFSSIFSS